MSPKHIQISTFISIGTMVIELCEFNKKKKKKKKKKKNMDKMAKLFCIIILAQIDILRKYLSCSLVMTGVVL